MPDVLVVQHIAIEEPYTIQVALERHGVNVHTWMVPELTDIGDDRYVNIPPLVELDGLVVMGGPQSAYSDQGFPTRARELELIREAHQSGRPVLGVCLGAQLIAVALGGEGRRGTAGFECGWAPVTRTIAPDPLFDGLGTETFSVLHWHGDTFTLPPDAVLLASNDRYEHQAFRVGASTWGIQFHIEVDDAAVRKFCDAFAKEANTFAPGGVAGILAATPAALAEAEVVRDQVFNRFAARIASESCDPTASG